MSYAMTTYQGRAGDRNPRGAVGAEHVGRALADRLGAEITVVGTPAEPLDTAWDVELEAATDGFRSLQQRFVSVFEARDVPITTLSRCAAAIATLPIVARYRPDALVVWFDAHADLNLPSNTTSGYLGGLAYSAPLGLWDSGFGAGVASGNALLVGARDLDPSEAALISDGIVRLVAVDDLEAMVAGRPIYVHIDCDVLEPGQVPTEYAVADGLQLADLERAMRALARSEVVGLEIAECQAGPGDEHAVRALVDAVLPLLPRH